MGLCARYYRSVVAYLLWFLHMKPFKFPWLSKLVYQMPTAMRASNLAVYGILGSDNPMYHGQFGILQFIRRVGYIIYNCKQSGVQRPILVDLCMQMFSFQRGFAVDLSVGRRPQDPEAEVKNMADRNEKIDCFAINALHHLGPFKPLIDVIYLNRKLLTGTGIQSPSAFQSIYMDLTRQEVNMFLRVIQRVRFLFYLHCFTSKWIEYHPRMQLCAVANRKET